MYCPKCKRQYDDPDMRFCEDCVIPLVGKAAPPPPPDKTPRHLTKEQGTPASVKGVMQCPQCKRQYDDPDMRFCEDCVIPLVSAAAVPPPPSTPAHRLTEEPGTPPAAVQKPPSQVIVEVRQEKKRRLNPLWLLLLLLLLLTCCCGLLLTEQVEVPDFAAPYVDPIINQVEKILPGLPDILQPRENGKGGDQAKEEKPISCEEFRDILLEADLGQDTTCDVGTNECYTDIIGLEDYEDIEISYDWEDSFMQGKATCEQEGEGLRCYFPKSKTSDRVDYWISIGVCEEELGYSDGWFDGEEEEAQAEEEIADCCEIVDVKKVRMEITNKFILKFDVECDGPWPASSGDCIPGKTYIGADQDIFWADMDCCPDSSADDLLHCESGHVDQKVSWTKVELSYGECDWKSPKFFTPAYQQDQRFPDSDSDSDCPSGESMCAGSCCSIGHCCTCDGSLGCWSNCSDTGCY